MQSLKKKPECRGLILLGEVNKAPEEQIRGYDGDLVLEVSLENILLLKKNTR